MPGSINNVKKAHKLLSSKGMDAFLEKNVFPEMNKLLSKIDKDSNVVIIECQTGMTAHFGGVCFKCEGVWKMP